MIVKTKEQLKKKVSELIGQVSALESALAGYHDAVEDHTYLDRKRKCATCRLLKNTP